MSNVTNTMVDMTLIRPLNKGQGQGFHLWFLAFYMFFRF